MSTPKQPKKRRLAFWQMTVVAVLVASAVPLLCVCAVTGPGVFAYFLPQPITATLVPTAPRLATVTEVTPTETPTHTRYRTATPTWTDVVPTATFSALLAATETLTPTATTEPSATPTVAATATLTPPPLATATRTPRPAVYPTWTTAPPAIPTDTPPPPAAAIVADTPTPEPQPTELPAASSRVGARCVDGTTSTATGSGACSHHGGVSCWLMSDGTCQPR